LLSKRGQARDVARDGVIGEVPPHHSAQPHTLPIQRSMTLLRSRPVTLSITHNFGSQLGAEEDVGEPGEPAPDHHVARRRVILAPQVASQPGDSSQVMGGRPRWCRRPG
jgi:hypothetical protein